MPQTTLSNGTPDLPTLYVSFELAQKEWKLALSTGEKPRVRTIAARDLASLWHEVSDARLRFGLDDDCRILAAYEAGRDGFWLQRLLESQGWEAMVVDPASLEVSRKARRAKTDRIDVKSIDAHLVRWDRGEAKALSVVRVPTVEQEDDRRREREIHRLTKERGQHSNRVKSLFALHGIELDGGRVQADVHVEDCRQWDGQHLPPHLVSEVKRELARLALVEEQLKELKTAQLEEQREAATTQAKLVQGLTALRGIGAGTAWPLVQELFAVREFGNRRELASFVGLDPTPYMSGEMRRGPGISKAGNRRLRALLVESAWSWLRYQPDSTLAKWFHERFGDGQRHRRVGIVALARKLLIALWRFLMAGVVPEGAVLQTSRLRVR